MLEVDLTKPFELTIDGEIMCRDGKKYGAKVYRVGELPDYLCVSPYGRNVESTEDLAIELETQKPAASLPPVATPIPSPVVDPVPPTL